MRRWRLIIYSILCVAAVVVVLQLVANHSLVRSGTCDPIKSATRVEVSHVSSSTRVITDPQQIGQLIVFFNARRDVSVTIADEPIDRITAIFYNNGDAV